MCSLFYCVFIILLFSPLLIFVSPTFGLTWTTTYNPNPVNMKMDTFKQIELKIDGLNPYDPSLNNAVLQLKSHLSHVADVDWKINLRDHIGSDNTFREHFNVTGIFLGRTNITLQLIKENNKTENANEDLQVIVTRADRIIDHIFTGSVAALVSVLYINFGAALDTTQLREILIKPIGPVIGFFGQFVVMPLLSFGIGHFLFQDLTAFQLGLFFTGVSPAGGASNIWTLVLNGNVNLSITMTTISTFAAFGMMPLWLFTLGKVIFDRQNLEVPYEKIAYFAFGLIIPLGIGLLIQKYLPRCTRILVKILKPVSGILILFIIIFATVTNLYLFELFSWKIIVAGLTLPLAGYVLGWILAKVCKQKPADCLSIAIETGIQNTGIAVFLLRVALPQPDADLTTVIPVAVSLMTPFPLMLLYIIQKIQNRFTHRKKSEFTAIED